MNLKKIVSSEVPELVKLYKYLHANPELSSQEEKTSILVADKLEECGINVTGNFGGHGVVGVFENGDGPTIMVRADMDALPITEETGLDYASTTLAVDKSGNKVRVMHACGHDIHMTTLIGAAKVLTGLKKDWSGRIVFVGQPAEESMSGARQMIQEGLFSQFSRPDYCLATHVIPRLEAGRIAVRHGPVMAGTFQLKISVRGVGGHGAIPQESRDPVVLAARIITSFQTIVSREFNPLSPAVLTVGSIHGGTRSNIIPDEVVLEVTARFFDAEGRNRIYDSVQRICRHEALSMDIPSDRLPVIELDNEGELPATSNDPFLADVVRDAVLENLGAESFCEAEMLMGSEDFALFSSGDGKPIPCCLFFTGATSNEDMELLNREGVTPPSLHNCRFFPPPEKTIETAVTTMCATVLKLLS